jgi:hypothetical protein
MKNALLVAPTNISGIINGYKNIGDYIQSLVGEIFFDKIDEYIDREKLSEYKSDSKKTRMIMNAWYMWCPEKWPPSDDIVPLLISMHFSPVNALKMLSEEGISYLKKHGPVGCRDKATESLLQKHDIPCYFSGCLTLILGEKYKSNGKRQGVLFVDPYIESFRNGKGAISILNILKSMFYGIINLKNIKKLWGKFNHSKNSDLGVKVFNVFLKFLNLSEFYTVYSKCFDNDLLFSANYIPHRVKVGENTVLITEEDKLDYARSLMQKYSDASLVITGRLHCALPCLGIETPVLFTTGDQIDSNAAAAVRKDRFEGLSNLLHVFEYKNHSLKANIDIKNKITVNHEIKNKDDYLQIKEILLKKCYEFISSTEQQSY